MKKKSVTQAAFFNLRFLIAVVVVSAGVFLALLGSGAFSKANAQGPNQDTAAPDPNRPQPDVVAMVGPVSLNQDLRNLPYIAPAPEIDEQRLTRYPRPERHPESDAPSLPQVQALIKNVSQPTPTMPGPLLTFDGLSVVQSGCGCLPPDSNGDVGPNHYVNAVNSSIKIFDKAGNPLNGANGTTFNSFFSPIGATNPCGANQNRGDPFVFYDHLADRWVVSDFAFPAFPGTSFWQCIGVSQTPNPVSGGWFLYAVQLDPTNTNRLGDYPKLALWNNPQPGGAYLMTANEFTNNTTFNGVRVYAFDRGSMLTGGPTHAVGFTIAPAGLGDSYSLVPAGFRTGTPPPAGRNEFLLSVDSPSTGGVTLTQVHGWLFHIDFVTPANSTLGVGVNHTPNTQITVSGFVDAFTDSTSQLVPEPATTAHLDTLGDKIMTPLVYQNRNGTESLWASQTVILNYPNGPTGVRWYQFNVTGGTFPATPAQQQTWTNNNDGLWRWMSSIAADANGNVAIGYSTSSASAEPSIRYAGRLATDPVNNLGQGEAIMTPGVGHQTFSNGRWGDYSNLTIDSDNYTFWHVNEYYPATASSTWFTRIGKFRIAQNAVSRKVHGAAGTFDIDLPLTGTTGVEDRTGGATNDFTIVVTFPTNVTVTGSPQAQVTSGTGTVGSGGVSNGGAVTVSGNVVTIPLTSVADQQTINVTLNGVNSTGTDEPAVNVVIPMSRLLGDSNGNRSVNSGDVGQVKQRLGQAVTSANFRSDYNANGSINAGDVSISKQNTGHAIP